MDKSGEKEVREGKKFWLNHEAETILLRLRLKSEESGAPSVHANSGGEGGEYQSGDPIRRTL